MYQIVLCNGCGKAGQFDIKIEFEADREVCKACAHDNTRPWVYNFCILPCFVQWLSAKKISELGFPCQDCKGFSGESTGFAYSIEQNGPCQRCSGSKAVRGRLVHVDPFEEHEAKKKT